MIYEIKREKTFKLYLKISKTSSVKNVREKWDSRDEVTIISTFFYIKVMTEMTIRINNRNGITMERFCFRLVAWLRLVRLYRVSWKSSKHSYHRRENFQISNSLLFVFAWRSANFRTIFQDACTRKFWYVCTRFFYQVTVIWFRRRSWAKWSQFCTRWLEFRCL